MPRLILPILSVCLVFSCSQEQLAQDVQRLRLAFLVSRYQQDIEKVTLIAEVAPLYKEGEQLAVTLKDHLTPASQPLYEGRIEQTYQAKDEARQVLDKHTQGVERAAEIYKQKKKSYEEAEEAYWQAFREEQRWLGENPQAPYKGKDHLRLKEEINRFYGIRRDAKRAYQRSEEDYVQARKEKEDAETKYIQIVLHSWDWLDLYVDQLVQNQDEDAKEGTYALAQ